MADVDDKRHKAAKNEYKNIARDNWVNKYSLRLLKLWLQQPTPFDIACTYTVQIKEDIADFYEDPLKRKFIEETYN